MCDKFSDAEVKHIREINRQLIAAQNWLVERTKPILELHHETKDTWSERDDVGTGSFFRFSLGNRDPDFDPLRGYNNLLASFNKSPDAMLDSSGVFRMENMDEDNWNEDIEMFPELRDIWFCYLFHNLYEHQLDCDWNDVLKIGEIWVEHIYQKQLIRDWDDEPLPRGGAMTENSPAFFTQR